MLRYTLLFSTAAILISQPVFAESPIQSLTAVDINSAEVVTNHPDYNDLPFYNVSGSTLEVFSQGNSNYSVNNGSGGYTYKNIISDTYALSSLANGDLKTRATFGFGTDLSGGALMPVGANHGQASATALFGDSFTFTDLASDTPYIWTANSQAQFNFSIDGNIDIPSGIIDPIDDSPGQPNNFIHTSLTFDVFTPGGLDLYYQLQHFDFNNYSDFNEGFEALISISDQLDTHRIDREYWVLGDYISYFDEDPDDVIDVSGPNGANLNFNFNPGGDFEWLLRLDSIVRLDASLQNVTAMMDFSNTVTTGFTGPSDSVVYSNSGLFPGTLSSPTSAVPEPATWAMMLIGFGIIGCMRRRGHPSTQVSFG